jgi:hypothetical protein
MLAGRTEWRDIPFEVGSRFEFRTLSGRELDEAQEVATQKSLQSFKALGAELIAAIQQQQRETTAKAADSYDADTLIRYGLVGWSYDEPCNEEEKGRLDGRCRDWAAAQIIEMNTIPEGEGQGSADRSSGGKSPPSSGEPIESTDSD